mgnify:CR=1 FL=1
MCSKGFFFFFFFFPKKLKNLKIQRNIEENKITCSNRFSEFFRGKVVKAFPIEE